jgi:Bifunctional DNA primase/polymerase, N-terminal
MSDLIDLVVEYKWPVFPVRLIRDGERRRKIPLIKDWRNRASNDPAQIAAWQQEFPGAVFGIELGRANLIVVDADRHPGGADGVAALDQLTQDREWPAHPTIATAGGGFHHIFGQPPDQLGNSPGGLPDGIDVRGAGGWIVAPGSMRLDGASWRLIAGSFDDVPIVPEWLQEIIRSPSLCRGQGHVGNPLHGPLMAADGELPKPLYHKVLQLVPLSDRVTRRDQRRVIGILNIALRRTDYRNDGLNIAGFCLRELTRGGIIDRVSAEELLIDVATLNGYIATHGEKPAIATIRSGLGCPSH